MHSKSRMSCFLFFFQAEDGIRDIGVTGVQTCALPISREDDRLARASTRGAQACADARGAQVNRPAAGHWLTLSPVAGRKPEFSVTSLAAPGRMAVDWEERVDFRRLHEYRLGRARQAIGDAGLG